MDDLIEGVKSLQDGEEKLSLKSLQSLLGTERQLVDVCSERDADVLDGVSVIRAEAFDRRKDVARGVGGGEK